MPDSIENPADYAINESGWRRHETDAEHALRVHKAEQDTYPLFWQVPAVVAAKAEYRQLLHDLAGLNAPVYDRKREAALLRWTRSTAAARDLFNRSCNAIMRDGELPEELSRAWDFLIDPVHAAKLWASEQSVAA